MTVTFKVDMEVNPPMSVAFNVKLAFEAPHAASTLAVITPPVFKMFDTVTPFEGLALVIVTIGPPGPCSASPTLAIVEFKTGDPAWREMATAAIVGGVLIVRMAAVVVAVPAAFVKTALYRLPLCANEVVKL